MTHAVTDSFSAAHVERVGADRTGAIVHLRPWRLLTFQKVIVHRAVSHLFFDDAAYHKVSDPRDEDYLERSRLLSPSERAGLALGDQTPST